jgi:hypothetical protein
MFTAHVVTVHSEIEGDVIVKAFYDGITAVAAASQFDTGDSVAVTRYVGRFPNEFSLEDIADMIGIRLAVGADLPASLKLATIQP